jgi:preprotein translocase subunit SecG
MRHAIETTIVVNVIVIVLVVVILVGNGGGGVLAFAVSEARSPLTGAESRAVVVTVVAVVAAPSQHWCPIGVEVRGSRGSARA